MNMYRFLGGPFTSEQQFKQAVMRLWKARGRWEDAVEVENEEKAPGMPDAIVFCGGGYALIEFKLSDENGVITFQKTQPLFYKRHPKLRIRIFAWDTPRNRLVIIKPETIITAKSLRYKIPEETK